MSFLRVLTGEDDFPPKNRMFSMDIFSVYQIPVR